ncbi:Fic family protein [Terriglobus sp. RCC_193]|uniref:Fic family protein n=1 Tax=Terriglobus sp. RCC_193 TaxID=3239218 RepID=UPI00352689B3
MRWNWQQPDWPEFRWNDRTLAKAEAAFLRGVGVLVGSAKHLDDDTRQQLLVDAMSVEALTTSEIEGEMLNRASVQSSIQRQLGLLSDRRKVQPAEQGISELMVTLYRGVDEVLTEDHLFSWHRMIVAGRGDLRDVGRYRTSDEPMQVVSGASYAPKVHFEAPPSNRVRKEMAGFVEWFNRTAPGTDSALPALTRAGVAHLYFESIHPFEDGNGRIGRAIAEKALVQGFGQPVIVALARSILAHHGDYYRSLEEANKTNDVTRWLRWFSAIALEAQYRTFAQIDFVIHKTKMLDSLKGRINARQEKVLLRMFREGPEGFEGGMSAKKYSTIAETPPATTTRDLAGLVEAGALVRSGELKHTRYVLNIPQSNIPAITIDEAGRVYHAISEEAKTASESE